MPPSSYQGKNLKLSLRSIYSNTVIQLDAWHNSLNNIKAYLLISQVFIALLNLTINAIFSNVTQSEMKNMKPALPVHFP